MADECTDVANKEQFVTLTDHEDAIGVYNVGTIDANTLTTAIRDVLLCISLKNVRMSRPVLRWCCKHDW